MYKPSWMLGTALIVALVFGVMTFYSLKKNSSLSGSSQYQFKPVLAGVAIGQSVYLCEYIRAIGHARAAKKAELSFTHSGRVIALGKNPDGSSVTIGSVVRGPGSEYPDGQPLVYQNTDHLDNELDKLKARLQIILAQKRKEKLATQSARLEWEQKKKDLDRQILLLSQRAVSQANVDLAQHVLTNSELQYQQHLIFLEELAAHERLLNIEINQALSALKESILRAPFDGVIAALNAREFQHFQPVLAGNHEPAIVLVSTHINNIEVTLLAHEARGIEIGMGVLAGVEGVPGGVESITPTIDSLPRVRGVRTSFAGDSLPWLDGEQVPVRFIRRCQEDAIVVPGQALFYEGRNVSVFKVVNGQAVKTPVQTGLTDDGLVEIINGVEAGESIITSHNGIDMDGAQIQTDGF